MPSPNMETASGANRYDPVPIYQTGDNTGDLSISPGGVVDLSRRRQVLRQLDRLSRDIDNSRMMSAMDLFQQRAAAMLSAIVPNRPLTYRWSDRGLSSGMVIRTGVRVY